MEDEKCKDSHIEFLKELTEKLPPLNSLLVRNNNFVEYSIKGGEGAECVGMNLLNNGKVAVQDCFITPGGIFPNHIHEEVEYLIVYSGRVRVVFLDKPPVELGVGDFYRAESGEVHGLEGLEKSWLIGVTIPAAKGYPDGRR